MKIWVIKHKGADWWGNYPHSKEITITVDGKETTIYADIFFYRRKDAQLYLKCQPHAKLYEVVGKK